MVFIAAKRSYAAYTNRRPAEKSKGQTKTRITITLNNFNDLNSGIKGLDQMLVEIDLILFSHPSFGR